MLQARQAALPLLREEFKPPDHIEPFLRDIWEEGGVAYERLRDTDDCIHSHWPHHNCLKKVTAADPRKVAAV